MAQAVGSVLPLAVAIAIFPVPIIAVVLLLGSDVKGHSGTLAWAGALLRTGLDELYELLGHRRQDSVPPPAAHDRARDCVQLERTARIQIFLHRCAHFGAREREEGLAQPRRIELCTFGYGDRN